MAVPLSVGRPVRCRIWCVTSSFGGQASVNTIHYMTAAVGAIPATDLDVATALNNLLAVDMKSLLGNLATYRGVQAQILKPAFPYHAEFVEQFDNSLAGIGNAGPDMFAGQTCGLLSFQTIKSGPQFRGRFYIPFPSTESSNADGTPAASYIANAGDLAGTVGVGLAVSDSGRTATLVRVLLNGRNKAGEVPTPQPVLSTTVSGLWATQQRRGPFGRQNRSPI